MYVKCSSSSPFMSPSRLKSEILPAKNERRLPAESWREAASGESARREEYEDSGRREEYEESGRRVEYVDIGRAFGDWKLGTASEDVADLVSSGLVFIICT